MQIQRNVNSTTHQFTDYFKGFEKVEAVQKIFKEKTEEVLRNLKVEFSGMRGYMGVSDLDGHIIMSAHYLQEGDLTDIYLDIIHELAHVKQFMEGKKLFDSNYDYVERPTEIEAYCIAVEEARRLGFNDERICEYLKTEWMNEEDLKKLTSLVHVNYSMPSKEKKSRKRTV